MKSAYAPQEPWGDVIGNTFFGSKGYLAIQGYGRYATFPGREQEPGPQARQDGNHWANFIQAVCSGKQSDLSAPVSEGAISCTLMHLGNISYRLGRSLTFDSKTMTCAGDKEATQMFSRDYRKPYVVPGKV
jgi:hypothetical protein